MKSKVCNGSLRHVATIQSAHYSHPEIDPTALFRCDGSGGLHLRIVVCVRYDMTGDHDEFDEHIAAIDVAKLVEALLRLPVDPDGSFPGALEGAVGFGDPVIVERVIQAGA